MDRASLYRSDESPCRKGESRADGDSPEPADITAKLSLTYTAVPKTRLRDGTSDVDFQVADVDFEVLSLPFVVPDDQARQEFMVLLTVQTMNYLHSGGHRLML